MKILLFYSLYLLLSLTIAKRLIYKLPCSSVQDLQQCVGKQVITPSGLKQHKTHSGMIVADPLNANLYALTLAQLSDSGDMFCGNIAEHTNQIEVCIDYFGKMQVNAESGGFLGLAKNYQNDINWYFGASQYGYMWGSRLYKKVIDTNSWQTYCFQKTVTSDAFSISIEDWNYAGTTTKDAYFRNIMVYDIDAEYQDDIQIIQKTIEEYAVDKTGNKPYNQYDLVWKYDLGSNSFFFNLTFPLPDMNQILLLETYTLGIFVGLFPYQDNSTGVSLIEQFNPTKTIYLKNGNYYCSFIKYIEYSDFEQNYPCESISSNQNICYGKIYFYNELKADNTQTSYYQYRAALQQQLLRYDFELQTTKSYTATQNSTAQYNLTVKTLISDIPCEKCNCDNECTASVIIDASTYYTFTYCQSINDCSTNHSSGYVYGDQLVILITSKIGPHQFSIHSMYVYYPTANSDTAGDGSELPIEDLVKQQQTSDSIKYSYRISQQASNFQGGGKAAKLKILVQNGTQSARFRRLLESTATEVKKYDYSITVTEDTSVHTASTNTWNDVFEGLSYGFLGINIALICLLLAFLKRRMDISESIKFFEVEQNEQKKEQDEQEKKQESQRLLLQQEQSARNQQLQNQQQQQLNIQVFDSCQVNKEQNNIKAKQTNSTYYDQDSIENQQQ